jgi:putative hemolysin
MIAAEILLQLILIFINAFFAASEMALISVKRARLEMTANDFSLPAKKRGKASKLLKLTGDSSRFLATIQIGTTLAGFLGSAFAADNFAERLTGFLLSLGFKMHPAAIQGLSVIVITIILSILTLVLGELLPKQIALRKAEPMAYAIVNIISGIAGAFKPLVVFLTASTSGLLHLFRIKGRDERDKVTEEEIRLMVDTGSKEGAIAPIEKEIIHNVFEFNDRYVSEVMTHRTGCDILWLRDDDAAWEALIEGSGHSFYPVCGEDSDDIRGVLKAKDYFRLKQKSRKNVLQNAVHEPLLVPESLKADALFRKMKKRRIYFALVLDEYGGFVGLVTMDDLLEQLVGSLDDDALTPERPDIEKFGKGWRIKGDAALDRVERFLHINLPVEQYDNFGSYVFSLLGEVPADGWKGRVEDGALKIEIQEVKDRRLKTALVNIGT